MMGFAAAPADVQFAAQTMLFVGLVLQLFFCIARLLGHAPARRVGVEFAILLVLVVAEAVLKDIFYRARYSGESPLGAIDFPAFAVVFLALAVLAAQLCRVVYEWRFKPPAIGPHSIIEAVDTLPAAVCFFAADGSLVLANLLMHQLYRDLCPYSLQTLAEFERALGQCAVQPANGCVEAKAGLDAVGERIGVEGAAVALIDGESSLYRFPDGGVWRYGRQQVSADDGQWYTEVTFAEVGELYGKRLELERQTAQLHAMHQDIRALSDNMLELTHETELVAAKAALHDQMGAALTMLRHCLDGHASANAEHMAIATLQRAATDIHADAEYRASSDALTEFIRDAAFVHVQVALEGAMPKDPRLSALFIAAMRECLTNAVRHAGATVLEVRIGIEREEGICFDAIRITNNGTPPAGPVVPAGGLSNIANLSARLFAKMAIEWQPHFALTIRVPRQKEEG